MEKVALSVCAVNSESCVDPTEQEGFGEDSGTQGAPHCAWHRAGSRGEGGRGESDPIKRPVAPRSAELSKCQIGPWI